MPRTSNRAFSLAALDLVGVGAGPVDELVEGLKTEFDRHRQVLDLRLEAIRARTLDEGVEGLALVALGLVEAQPALDRVGHALGGQARLQAVAVKDLAALVVTAEVGDVGGDLALADLQRGAIETDVRDVVLGAAVRAAGHLDVDGTRERIGDLHRLQPLLDGAVEAHRGGDAELARVGAGARDDVGDLVLAGVAEAELEQALPYVIDGLVADPAQHQVLVDRGAGVAAAELAHDLRELAHLLGREVAAGDLHAHRREAVLALGLDAGLAEALELGEVAVGAARLHGDRRRIRLLVVDEEQVVDREVTLGYPVALELLLDHLAEGVDADLVDQDLDAGAGAVDAQPLLAVEEAEDGLGDLQVVAVVEFDEVVEGGGDAGHDGRAAADPHLDAPDAVADARDEADVVDAGDRDVLVGRGERRLDLARHQLGDRVADEVADVRARIGRDIEGLALGDAREGVAGDVAHRVAAALARGEAGIGDAADELGGIRQRDVVDLDVLARRDVALVEGRVVLEHVGERLHLLGRDPAHRQLRADHLHVGLALAVDALLEAEADELVLGLLAAHEARRLGVEVVELALEDRDEVPGHVVVDLGVLQRPAAPLSLLGLGVRYVELVLGGDPLARVRGAAVGLIPINRRFARGTLLGSRGLHAQAVLHKS